MEGPFAGVRRFLGFGQGGAPSQQGMTPEQMIAWERYRRSMQPQNQNAGFGGKGAEVQALAIISQNLPKIRAGTATPQEVLDYRLARDKLTRETVTYTPQGPAVQRGIVAPGTLPPAAQMAQQRQIQQIPMPNQLPLQGPTPLPPMISPTYDPMAGTVDMPVTPQPGVPGAQPGTVPGQPGVPQPQGAQTGMPPEIIGSRSIGEGVTQYYTDPYQISARKLASTKMAEMQKAYQESQATVGNLFLAEQLLLEAPQGPEQRLLDPLRNAAVGLASLLGGTPDPNIQQIVSVRSLLRRMQTRLVEAVRQGQPGHVSDIEFQAFRTGLLDPNAPQRSNLLSIRAMRDLNNRRGESLVFMDQYLLNNPRATLSQAQKAWREHTNRPENHIWKDINHYPAADRPEGIEFEGSAAATAAYDALPEGAIYVGRTKNGKKVLYMKGHETI